MLALKPECIYPELPAIGGKKNAAETGILMELQLENKYLNDSYNYSIWDGVLWSKAQNCENLDGYMILRWIRLYRTEKRN